MCHHTHTHTIFCWDFCFSSCSALSVSQWYRGVFQLSHIMVQYDYFVCPVGYDEVNNRISMECERSPTFILTEYHLPETLRTLFSLVIEAYNLHSCSFSSCFRILSDYLTGTSKELSLCLEGGGRSLQTSRGT